MAPFPRQNDVPNLPAGSGPIAVCRGLGKRFGEVLALSGLDLEIPRGIVGVLGPNGAGKSTLFRVLLGLESADAGAVEVLGLPLPEAALAVRARLGYMPEDDCLFPGLDGIEQILHAGGLCGLSRVDAQTRAHQALDLMGLLDARYRQASAYSLGMRQRLRLAMALVHGPTVLLLDEPTAGLDPDGRQRMLERIREIGESGTSILLSTHVLADVEAVCEQVVLLSRGRLGFVGPMSQFRSRSLGRGWRVRLVGEATAFAAALRAAGLGAVAEPGEVFIQGDDTALPGLWSAAAAAGIGILSLHLEEEGMAEAFVRHLRLDDPARRQGEVGR
jgi:ABC-2 type transport system ATP-binding protein